MKRKVISITSSVLLFNFINKIFGFLREIIIASNYGASYITDSYNIAMTVPNIILILVSAAITNTLIPIFSEIKENEEKKLNLVVSNVITISTIVISVVCLLLYIFRKETSYIIAPGINAETRRLVNSLLPFTILNIIFITITSILDALLYAEKRFNISAFSEGFLNLGLCIFMLAFKATSIKNVVIIYLLILIIRTVYLYWNLRKCGYKYKFYIDKNDYYLKEILRLMVPIMMTSSFLQVNSIIDKALTSTLEVGSISALSYATKIYTLAHSIVIYPVIKLIYPFMVKTYNNNYKEYINIWMKFVKVFFSFIIPIWIIIFINSKELVEIIFGRGNFDLKSIEMSTVALRALCILVVFLGFRDLIEVAFYSTKDTKTPSRNSLISIVLNIAFSIILIKKYRIVGVALSTVFAMAISTTILFIRLIKIHNFKINKEGEFFIINLLSMIGVFIIYKYVNLSFINSNFIKLIISATTIIVSYLIIQIGIYVIYNRSIKTTIKSLKYFFNFN